jgi:hypothetical protein
MIPGAQAQGSKDAKHNAASPAMNHQSEKPRGREEKAWQGQIEGQRPAKRRKEENRTNMAKVVLIGAS